MNDRYPKCISCGSNNSVIRTGIRNCTKKQTQRYYCKKCKNYFTNEPLGYTVYPVNIILSAITTYNSGYTLKQTRTLINHRFKIKLPRSTLHSWLNRYQHLCTFTRSYRSKFNLDPYTLIYSKKLYHQQVYEFKYHTLKLNLAGKTFPRLKTYIRSVPRDCPHSEFQSGPRCSGLRVDFKPTRTSKTNNASKLVELALTLARTSYERHEKVENFFLVNDSASVAIEVPVYIFPNEITVQELQLINFDLTEPLTGHIDLIQVRFNRVHILDYKPDAKLNDARAVEQLFLYAIAISKRTKIPISTITCAYFDENNYFQFEPGFNVKKHKEYK